MLKLYFFKPWALNVVQLLFVTCCTQLVYPMKGYTMYTCMWPLIKPSKQSILYWSTRFLIIQDSNKSFPFICTYMNSWRASFYGPYTFSVPEESVYMYVGNIFDGAFSLPLSPSLSVSLCLSLCLSVSYSYKYMTRLHVHKLTPSLLTQVHNSIYWWPHLRSLESISGRYGTLG